MTEPAYLMMLAATGLASLVILAYTALKGWSGWLALRHAELEHRHGAATPPSPTSRIELADLRERVRKLEAIAAGVDI